MLLADKKIDIMFCICVLYTVETFQSNLTIIHGCISFKRIGRYIKCCHKCSFLRYLLLFYHCIHVCPFRKLPLYIRKIYLNPWLGGQHLSCFMVSSWLFMILYHIVMIRHDVYRPILSMLNRHIEDLLIIFLAHKKLYLFIICPNSNKNSSIWKLIWLLV